MGRALWREVQQDRRQNGSRPSCTTAEAQSGEQNWERSEIDEGRQYEFDQATYVPCAIRPRLDCVPGAMSCTTRLVRGVQHNSEGWVQNDAPLPPQG